MRFWGEPRGSAYADRREAGLVLADRLREEHLEGGVVVGLARGGVVVAAEVARRLGLPLDALAVRKVRHPFQPEYGIGAVTPGGGIFVRPDLDVTAAAAGAAVASARSGAEALDRRIHAACPPAALAGRTCVLVDDGLATGATMVAAARWARSTGASRVVIAVPVGPAATLEQLRAEADLVVCAQTPATIFSVGEWYGDFRQVSDDEVATLLEESSTAGDSASCRRRRRHSARGRPRAAAGGGRDRPLRPRERQQPAQPAKPVRRPPPQRRRARDAPL